MRAAMYPRVSTDMQRGNYSVPSQIKDMMHYANVRNYTLVGDCYVNPRDGRDSEKVEGSVPAFVDDFTSTELSRPGLNACLLFLKNVGFDVLLVHTIDRLARDPYFRQTIEREVASLGARVEYVLGNYDESPEGEVRKDLDSTFAKWENAKRVERSNRGKKRKAEMGKFVAGAPPYGYRINPELESGLEVYEPEADVVRLIFKWYVEDHLSIRRIAGELERNKIKTYHGLDKWQAGTVARILKSTAYAGYAYYNKTKRKGTRDIKRDPSDWIKIKCTPIVPQEVFDEAKEILDHNKERRRRLPKRFYLLSGMIFCSECRYPYFAQHISGGPSKSSGHRYKKSKGYRHKISHGHCSNRWISSKNLEPVIWEAVTQLLLDPISLRKGYEKMMASEAEKQSRQIRHLEVLGGAIEKLNAKRTRLQAVYLDPDIGMSKEEYLAEKKLLDDQIRSAQEEIEKTTKELSKIPSESDLIHLEEMAAKIVNALGRDLDIPDTEKRRIMKLLNLRVILTPDKEIKLEGFFYPESSGLLSTAL